MKPLPLKSVLWIRSGAAASIKELQMLFDLALNMAKRGMITWSDFRYYRGDLEKRFETMYTEAQLYYA